MQCLRRLIAWSFFLGFLAAFGTGVFYLVRYRPRFELGGKHFIEHLSADGRWLVTSEPMDTVNAKASVDDRKNASRLHVFDTHRRQRLHVLDDVRPWIHSPDDRYIVCRRPWEVLLFDWQSLESWTIPLGERGRWANFEFSPQGLWLLIRLDNDRTAVVDVTRSEERRVGKECRSRWSTCREKKGT